MEVTGFVNWVSKRDFTVWVSGVKVHDNLLSYAAAIDLFDKYKSEGYYNVFIGNQFKGKL
jgi:hypothetical protein